MSIHPTFLSSSIRMSYGLGPFPVIHIPYWGG